AVVTLPHFLPSAKIFLQVYNLIDTFFTLHDRPLLSFWYLHFLLRFQNMMIVSIVNSILHNFLMGTQRLTTGSTNAPDEVRID
ncbi:hypothetical protein ACJX0J_036110, partial [Zea mays]